MAEELQSLLEKIQSDGIARAEAERDAVVAKAGKEAQEIVARAKQEAEAILAAAAAEAQSIQKRAESTIRQAARDIATSNMAVEEVAAKWGFFDSSHFCHAFKKIYQCSPSEFRRKRHENQVL